jgi:dolichol-phosphate mannosyltransferase
VISSLSIVIPAYNERASIVATVEDALAVGAGVARELEVLVCDDGSRDGLDELVGAMARADSRIRLLVRPINRGIEASIRTLYARARHDWVFLNSADRQWPMAVLRPMADAARDADFVIGRRRDKRDVYSVYRSVLSYGYEGIVRVLGGAAGDPGSIKLARRALLHRAVVARGVFAEGERVIRASREGARVVEVPVEFNRRTTGKARGARLAVVARAAVDTALVVSSLVVEWPPPILPVADV